VLGTEPQIVQEYVETGKVKVVFWPVLNHGNPSFYSTLASECVGQQDPDLFWQVHEVLFEKQSELWSADRDYYVQTAVAVGADQAAFEACYDGAEAQAKVQELDDLRRERGIYSQPTFDINGTVQGGAPRFEIFAAVLDDAYNAATP
jgi:protein-disulfide isomerase